MSEEILAKESEEITEEELSEEEVVALQTSKLPKPVSPQ